ncbi:MAG: hypothetical protein O3B73_12770 [bacterium]|nr:hypothetical protein [bacterium]
MDKAHFPVVKGLIADDRQLRLADADQAFYDFAQHVERMAHPHPKDRAAAVV